MDSSNTFLMEAEVSALMSVADKALSKSVRLFSLTNVQTVEAVLPPSSLNLADHLLSSSFDTSEPLASAPLSPSASLLGLVSSFGHSGLHQSVGFRERRPSMKKWKPKSSR